MRTIGMRCIPLAARMGAALVGLVLSAASAGGAGTTAEFEPNDSFHTRQGFGAGDVNITARITDVLATPDRDIPSSLIAQEVTDFVEMSLGISGDPFIAWIDNVVPNSTSNPDTRLGSFDAMDSLISSDDDASPVGNGTASALLGTVNVDGTIRLSVTGSGDTGFSGAHSQQGDFDLLIALGEPDLDFFSFRGLLPLEPFRVEVVAPDAVGLLKTLLWLNGAGVPIETVFNSFPLCIEGAVPPNGVVNFAVAGGEDRDADGIPDTGPGADDRIGIGTGDYTLVFVPEPSSVALWLAAIAVLTALPRRRGTPTR